jgi:adenylate cyclase
MYRTKQLFFVTLLVISFNVRAQKQDTASVNGLLLQSKGFFGKEPAKAIALAEKARQMAKDINYPKGEATALKNIGIVYYMQQNYLKTLDNWLESLAIFEKEKDDNGIANLLNNIAAVYKDQGEDDKALEYSLRSLAIAEKTKDKLRIMSSLVTIASVYHNKRDPRALEYLQRAEKLADKDALGVLYGNIGEVYYDLGEASEKTNAAGAGNYYLQALHYYEASVKADHQAVSTSFAYNGIGKIYFKQGKMNESIASHRQALAIAEALQDKWNIFKAHQGMANAYMKLNNTTAALENYSKAEKFAEEVDNTDIADLYKDLAVAYETIHDFKNALLYNKKHGAKEQEIYDITSEKKLGRLQLRYDLDQKEASVNILTREKQIERQQKTGFAIGLGLICILAFVLYRNFRAKARVNKILDKQKAEIEGLLLNILPAEVARELQTSGSSTPRHHEDVAVLFTDFKGFTSIADRMSPADLVNLLNECFVAFDNIIGKYDLEKIKTIGDAYMCAAGIPSKGEKDTYRIVKAAIEIQEWVTQNNLKRIEQGMEPWEIRIGVHTGALVAGVVGKKKYAYDIWGTTVNIAKRMESNGEPGRVNISAAAYGIIRNDFECVYRGKINAKNIGDIDMYFVEKEFDRSYRVIGTETGPVLSGTALN